MSVTDATVNGRLMETGHIRLSQCHVAARINLLTTPHELVVQ